MPPAISDSEDDDEILVADKPSQKNSQRSTFSAHAEHAAAMLAVDIPMFDGAGDVQPASTTSSELRRQILSAERNLAATASDRPSRGTPAMVSSNSPVLQKDKRRRATAVESQPSASPPKSVKRTKTTALKTYGKSPRITRGDDGFAAFREDALAEDTSETFRFSDHSNGPKPSSGLAAGTIQQDFINHEPAVMFRDTGSTNAFNDSSQQRLVEQALDNGKQEATTSAQKLASSEKQQQSSSFPWSASADPTQGSPKSNESKARSEVERQPEPEGDTIAVKPSQPSVEPTTNENGNSSKELPEPDETMDRDGPSHIQRLSSKSRAPPRSSPIVEIPRYEAPIAPAQTEKTADSQKSSRGRKRKPEDELEQPFNSDDKHIGLPKDQYQPRPSRRRATGVIDEPIDYSVVPEKAAKKRRKTASGSLGATESQAPSTEQPASRATEAVATAIKSSEPETPSAKKKNEVIKEPSKEPTKPAEKEIKSSQQSTASEALSPEKRETRSAKKAADSMSMKPPALPASSSKKVRRSHTTIFEDHVESGRSSQMSPSLSQQQASRKSALTEVRNESTKSKQKQRRSTVQDDEDEDELAQDMPAEEDEVAPKKRGKGAAPKAISNKKGKSKEKVLDDSEQDDEETEVDEQPQKKSKSREKVLEDSEDEDDLQEVEVAEPPKKKRGRPAKAKVPDADEEDEPEPEKEEPPKKKKPGRPSKAKVVDSDDEDELEFEEEEPPKKKKLGRPPKAKGQAAAHEKGKDSTEEPPVVEQAGPEKLLSSDLAGPLNESSPTKAALERKDSNAKVQSTEKKSNAAPASTPDKSAQPPAKASPNTHSPIKGSSYANYRVGLSKKSRIPSLLKSFRAPAPPRR